MIALRTEDYCDRRAVLAGSMRALARLAEKGRRARRKPRSAEQQAMLRAMAIAAVRQQIDSGRLERVAPREYVLHERSSSHASATP